MSRIAVNLEISYAPLSMMPMEHTMKKKTFRIPPWHLATYSIENYTSNYNHLSVWWANLCAYVTLDAVTAIFVVGSGSCNMQSIVSELRNTRKTSDDSLVISKVTYVD